MISFTELKNNRVESFKKISEKLQALAKPKFDGDPDPTFWQPGVDKAGVGYAIIRLLPPPQGEEEAVVRMYRHAFKGPDGWYIENSLTTFGKDDPVAKMNNYLWKNPSDYPNGKKFVSGDADADPPVKGSKRATQYTCNIFVVHDQANPDNDNKVFKWQFGPKLYAKIQLAETPEFPDVQAFSPFDLWGGACLKLKIRKQGKYRNYDQSEWDMIEDGATKKPRGAFSATKTYSDDELEQIWKSEYSLQEVVAEKHFKSYNTLLARLTKIMSGNVPGLQQSQTPIPDIGEATGIQKLRESAGRQVLPEDSQTPPWDEQTDATGTEELSEMDEFRRLAESDD